MYNINERKRTLLLPPQHLKKRQEVKIERNPLRTMEGSSVRLVTIQPPSSAPIYETSDIWLEPPYDSKHAEYVFVFLGVEKKAVMPSIPRGLRMNIFNQMLKLNGPLGHPAVLQAAQWYCDSVVDELGVSLKVNVATCFWMARKLYGPVYKPRRLLLPATKAYECKLLSVTERKILQTLESTSRPIVPQTFINYLAGCDVHRKVETELAATFICTASMMAGHTLAEQYPSVLAAAAVYNAVQLLQKPRAMDKLATNALYNAAAGKTQSLSSICDMQKMAIRIVSAQKRKRLVEYFNKEPHYIASRIIRSIDLL